MSVRPSQAWLRLLGGIGQQPIRRVLLGAVLLGLCLAFGRGAPPAAAHAFVQRSDPPANAVLASSPKQITIWFTENIEPNDSTAQLFDQHGKAVPGTKSHMGDTTKQLIVEIPHNLANGTYSVVWQNISADDGHEAQGYFAFTVGSRANVAAVAPPPLPSSGGPPLWLQMIARWVAYLGLAAAVAVWPIWLLVMRPALDAVGLISPAAVRRMQRLAMMALGTAFVGNIFALLVQAGAGSGGYGHQLISTLTDSRYGKLWFFRIGLLALYGAGLLLCNWSQPWRRQVTTWPALVLALLLPVPFSLIAHASAQDSGRTSAIAFDVLHLAAAGLWAGGLFCLLGFLPFALRQLKPGDRRALLVKAIPRFSLLALSAWGVLGLTGLYSAWLQVGNWTGLTDTAYGKTLIAKILFLVPVLLLASFNLLIVSRRLRQATSDAQEKHWDRHLIQAVAGEAFLVIVVFLVVGRLTAQPPAREVLAARSGQEILQLSNQGRSATLSVSPATPGFNHYRLEVGGSTLPAATQAILRVSLPGHNTNMNMNMNMGQTDINLVRAAGNAFEGHTSDLSMAGKWTVEVIIRTPNQADWTVTKTLTIGTTPPTAHVPSEAWHFNRNGVIGLLLIVVGIASAAFAWFIGKSPLRKESIGLGIVATALGVIILLQARTTAAKAHAQGSANPIAATTGSVALGKEVYTLNCASCHGVDGKGDGPAGKGLFPVPADFTIPHSKTHLDQDFDFWIKNGIQGSAMPAFKGKLSDTDVWDVINYIRVHFQGRPLSGSGGAPAATPMVHDQS